MYSQPCPIPLRRDKHVLDCSGLDGIHQIVAGVGGEVRIALTWQCWQDSSVASWPMASFWADHSTI